MPARVDPREVQHVYGLITAFNFQAAEPRLLDMRTAAPTDPGPIEALAQLYRLMNRYDEALGAARLVAAMRPTSTYAHGLLSYVFNGAGRHAEAADAAVESIRLGAYNVNAYWMAAVATNALGRFQEGMSWARQGLALDPTHGMLRQSLGAALAGLDRPDDAEAVVAEYLRQDPADFNAHVAAGWTYLRLGWLDRAAERFLTALELQPNYAWQHEGLGIVRYKQGRFAEARHLLTEAARLDPAMDEGRAILDQLLAADQSVAPDERGGT